MEELGAGLITISQTEKESLHAHFRQELKNILDYWVRFSQDSAGGFYGEIDEANHAVTGAVKGAVLNARILWTFSASLRYDQDEQYQNVASRAFAYFRDHFIDQEFGGVYWSVTADGEPGETKKQIYAIAFAIYAFAEYHHASGSEESLNLAIQLYQDIEQHSLDREWGGYFEAFTRDWKELGDLRLSQKDANEKKTMNTHLHILEAYTGLYNVWPDSGLAERLHSLLNYFKDFIINRESFHLNLFMNEKWEVKSDTISYGHDIEASWLLAEAATALNDEKLIKKFDTLSIKLANAAAEGLSNDGGIIYEYEPMLGHRIAEYHWWVQAEALVGFYHAFQLTQDKNFFDKVKSVWTFINTYIIDHSHGEWYWGRHENGEIIQGQGKVGFWKCPYHNSRACLEMLARLIQ